MASFRQSAFLGLLALHSIQVEAAKWDPKPRSNDNLIAKRHGPNLPRAPRLAKRQGDTVRPGQPTHRAPDEFIGGFEVVGDSGVSGQQMFLGTDTKVYIVDKVENNPLRINDHPAWAVEFDLDTHQPRAMDVLTNTFCAGGGLLADGRWLNVGGNKATGPNGDNTPDDTQETGENEYRNRDGRNSLRILNFGADEWIDDPANDLSSERWYPTLETLPDGRIIIIGGATDGAFINNERINNPTYEFYPPAAGAAPIAMELLSQTNPANLYPITYLIPLGTEPPRLLINANRRAIMFDWTNNNEGLLPDIPDAIRTYPASAATFMLPMSYKNNFDATVYFCGGSDVQPEDWFNGSELIYNVASASCVKITPISSGDFEEDEDLPQARVMGSAILLPDGKVWLGNGANRGLAGYGADPWTNQDSYADDPLLLPLIYDPEKPLGERWSSDGLQASGVPRMYHSTATLLPDGSIMITGSNPHPDVELTASFPSEYRVERFYPQYYNERRPEPSGVPTQLYYGGDYFDMQVDLADLFDNLGNLQDIKIMVMKTGFSTHGINFGMRAAVLDYTYTVDEDKSGATLHVSHIPNPNIIPPGPAWLFVTIKGVPSVGVQVMVGSGAVGEQAVDPPATLPQSSNLDDKPDDSGPSSAPRSAQVASTFLAVALAFVSLWV